MKAILKRKSRGEAVVGKDQKEATRANKKKKDSVKDSPLQRTATILEMTRWQDESQETKIEIFTGTAVSDEEPLDEDPLLLPEEKTSENDDCNKKKTTTDVDAYMASREMSELQERGNALTMIPSPLYCLYYVLAGKWLTNSSALLSEDNTTYFDESECIKSSWFPQLHAMPPLPVVFVALGIGIHAPFSFVYHWKYAHALPPGFARTDHLSRRLDQAMIHVASAICSYATSANWQYFGANCLYNYDCFRRQFHKEINPRRNQIRIAISMVFYTLPILARDLTLFFECWSVILVSVWLFVRYPFGGWSHSAFHLVIALLPPLLMEAACLNSQQELYIAAKCAALSES